MNDMTIGALRSAYLEGRLTPRDVLAGIVERCARHDTRNIWIHRLSDAELEPYLEGLESRPVEDAPLWTLDRAVEFSAACTDLQVGWIEEPLDMHAYDEMAELRERSAVPIAGGELNGGWHEFKVMLEKGSLDIYQPDATMGGGVSDAKRVLEACRSRGLGFAPHTWTNGLGFLVNLHVHAAGPRDHPQEYPYEPPGWVPEARDGILKEPILVDADGTVAVPEAPGLGIELDEQKLARHGKRFFEITSRGLAAKTIREKGLFTALRLGRKKRRSQRGAEG